MATLAVEVASGDVLDVRAFTVSEGLNELFQITLTVVSEAHAIDLEAAVGKPASFTMVHYKTGAEMTRRWDGVCSYMEQTQAETTGLSSYRLTIVPALWLAGQRSNHRIFQHQTVQEIVSALLAERGVAASWQLTGTYLPLEYRMQYGEDDLQFIRRLLEEAGITFLHRGPLGSALTLLDEPTAGTVHGSAPIANIDEPYGVGGKPFVTSVHLAHGVRSGAHEVRDYDFRKPDLAVVGTAPAAPSPENALERYDYRPGAFQLEGQPGGGTPVADDKAVARRSLVYGTELATRRLAAMRGGKRSVFFETNASDLEPGTIFSIDDHPHPALAPGNQLLVTDLQLRGRVNGPWQISGTARFIDEPYYPPLTTGKPAVKGVQTAVVVGPPGEEIYVDEFGRVRVQFPWDREGKRDDNSSVWMRVSQSWAGAGYGFIQLPRIGQEVLVGFVDGDPDLPIVVGRVYNALQQVHYTLPLHKTRSSWKSNSSPTNGGFNEILFEDLQGSELVYMQAEKNQRRLVKNDEMITIGRDRGQLVKRDEVQTILGNRTEVTVMDRIELTDANRIFVTGGNQQKLVTGNETVRTDGNLQLTVVGTAEVVVQSDKKELLEANSHLHVKADRNTSIDGTHSLTIGVDQPIKVGNNHAVDAGNEIHLKAGMNLVIESGLDLTLKGAGGFIRIDATGVTVMGTLVKINSGGSPGSGAGASPTAAEDAAEAQITAPEKPKPDDVQENGLAQ